MQTSVKGTTVGALVRTSGAEMIDSLPDRSRDNPFIREWTMIGLRNGDRRMKRSIKNSLSIVVSTVDDVRYVIYPTGAGWVKHTSLRRIR